MGGLDTLSTRKMQQSAIKASGQLTVGDLYRFSLHTLFRRFRWFLGIVAAGALFFVTSLLGRTFHWEWTWSNIVGPLILFVLVPYAFLIAPYFAARKQLANPNVGGPKTYVFSEAGIELSGPTVQAHLEWSSVVEVRETSRQMLLYPQQSMAFVLPKRFFESEADMAALRALISAKVKHAKLRQR